METFARRAPHIVAFLVINAQNIDDVLKHTMHDLQPLKQ
jgi:hypothetical protein